MKIVNHSAVIIRSGVLLLVLFLCAHTILAQAQPPAPAPAPATSPGKPPGEKQNAPPAVPTGTIKGRVIADDGRVLAKVTVMARAINGTMAMKASTPDAEGRFSLEDLSAAVYMVFATAPGYIDESMAVAEADQLPKYLIGSQLRIRLVKGGVITGLVTNSKGQPVVGIPVRAAPTKGVAFFMNFQGAIGGSETDDRGIYRLYGLPPGQYTVEAGGGGPFGRFSSSGFELDVPTFYPSSPRDTAVPVAVRAGEEATGIDIRYKGTAGHSISGTLSGKSDAFPGAGMGSVMLSHAGTTNIAGMAVTGLTEQSRSFRFEGVDDGDYDLFSVSMTSPTDNGAAGSRRVTVRGGDVTGVELALTKLSSIAGSIKLDPIAPEAKCDKRGSELNEISIQPAPDDPKKGGNKILANMFSAFGSTQGLNGDFSVRNLYSGIFRLGVKLPTDAWYVRVISLPTGRGAQSTVGSTDQGAVSGPGRAPSSPPAKFWPGTMAIKSGESISGVSILVGQDAAGLRGNISTTPEGGSITPGIRVHLVPAERDEAGNVLRYFETAVESNGSFTFTNLAPGRYFIIPRLEPPATTEALPRPVAFNVTARATLRREAETLNNVVELKPCQRVVDLALKPKPSQ